MGVVSQSGPSQSGHDGAQDAPQRQTVPVDQEIELVNDEDGDAVPPPAYGEAYGELRDQTNGTGTSAQVTDDGRVNIRVTGFSYQLSQMMTPALRQQAQDDQDTRPLPPPYIPPSLGGHDGVPPPRMNVVIQVVGSRGDVQPFVALGKVLKNTYGHRVRVATHPTFRNFVRENGLEFFSIGGDPAQLMAFMVKNPGLRPGISSIASGDVGQRRRDVAEYIQGCWRSCYLATDGTTDTEPMQMNGSEPIAKHFVADCIIANPPSFAHIHCAEKLGIPLHIMFTMPCSPTQAFPHPLANIQQSSTDPQLTNYISYGMIDLVSWQVLGDIINRFRGKCLALDPVGMIWGPGMLQRMKIPHTYSWSPTLIPKPKDWGSHISIAGFYFLDQAATYTPAPELQAFLESGPAPVYIGFGSIVLKNPDAMTELIFETVRKTGQRVLLSKGWGGMGANELNKPDGVFMLENVPHDWLFQHVSCVVHHGGAGTTATGIKAGRPTVVVPFFGDQPFWGAMVAQAGAGPAPIPHKQLTADKLADAIKFCLKYETTGRAKILAAKIAQERGTDTGAQSFHQQIEPDRLRCDLAPSRTATWRVKRSKFRLSAFAACTLANAKLIDLDDLKLYRPQEHYTDEGPWDPISGGFTAFLGAVGGMSMGLIDIPGETWRAVSSAGNGSANKQKGKISPNKSETSLATGSDSSAPTVGPSSQLSRVDTTTSTTSSSKEYADKMAPTGVHVSRGAGRFVKALVQGPVDISVNLTRGSHNLPRLWGDDTVRPQERVSDMKSGVRAMGREFGLGWYDGITGLATQPWRGAQKGGATGFVKGVGKGLGGFIAKPTAACLGILSHTLQGASKEVQKLFGSDVGAYIIASRVAQGYEDWLASSEEEKQDVIERWKQRKTALKGKRPAANDTAEGNKSATPGPEAAAAQQSQLQIARSESSVTDQLTEQALLMRAKGVPAEQPVHRPADQPSEQSVQQPVQQSVQQPVQQLVYRAAELPAEQSAEQPARQPAAYSKAAEAMSLAQQAYHGDSSYQPQQIYGGESQYQPPASFQGQPTQDVEDDLYDDDDDDDADRENLLRAIAASEAEAQDHSTANLQYERQLKQAMTQSMMDHQSGSHGSWGNEYDDPQRQSVVGPPASSASELPGDDPGHLGGITQREFEAQQRQGRGEKTAEERKEEDIVLEYVKKQSLLEMQHRNSRTVAGGSGGGGGGGEGAASSSSNAF